MTEQFDPARGSVILRPLSVADVEMVRELSTDPYVPRIGSLVANANESQALDWIQRQRAKARAGLYCGFCVVVVTPHTAAGIPVGTCGLSFSGADPHTAAGGYAIAPSHRGHGWAALALNALVDAAAGRPGIDLVELFIEDWNLASQRTAERAGFTLDGRSSHPRRTGDEPVTMLRWVRPTRAAWTAEALRPAPRAD